MSAMPMFDPVCSGADTPVLQQTRVKCAAWWLGRCSQTFPQGHMSLISPNPIPMISPNPIPLISPNPIGHMRLIRSEEPTN